MSKVKILLTILSMVLFGVGIALIEVYGYVALGVFVMLWANNIDQSND